ARHMARQGGVVLVGQAEREQAGAPALRLRVAAGGRQKALEHDALHLGSRKAGRERIADERGSDSGNRYGDIVGWVASQQTLFGCPAGEDQLREAFRIESLR